MTRTLALLVALIACMAPAYASAQGVDRGAHGTESDPATPPVAATPAANPTTAAPAPAAPHAVVYPGLTPQQAAAHAEATRAHHRVSWPLVTAIAALSVAAFMGAVYFLSRGIRKLFPPRRYA